MSESDLHFIENILNETGMKYQKYDEFYQTFWTDDKLDLFSIVVFVDSGFCNISSQLDWNKIQFKKSENKWETLNKLNLTFHKVKFVIDKANHLLLLYQEEMMNLDSDKIMSVFKLFVKIINNLYYK